MSYSTGNGGAIERAVKTGMIFAINKGYNIVVHHHFISLKDYGVISSNTPHE